MRALLALITVAHCCFAAELYAAPVVSCNRPPQRQEIIQYQRVHDITIRRPARGPDAIEYEAVELVSAMDRLAIWHSGPDSICISLTTFDQDAHECSIDGLATKDAAGEFVFSEEACAVRMSIGPEQARVRAPKDGCKSGYCAKNGVIEDAAYERK
jgi:hypothetical protein